MGAIAVTAEDIVESPSGLRPWSLKPLFSQVRILPRQPADNIRTSNNLYGHPPLLGPIIESETDEAGCSVFQRKETAPNEHRSQY